MSSIQIRNKRPAWAAGFALSILAAAALSGCGGGGDGGDGGNGGGGGGGGNVGTADLTAAGTKAQVGTFGTLISALNVLDSLSDTSVPDVRSTAHPFAKAARVRVKAAESCEDGGTTEDTGPTSKDVKSPFTTSPIEVSGSKATNCKYAESTSSGGQNVDYVVTINGITEGGELDGDDAYVQYFRIGDDSGPFSVNYNFKSSGSAGGQSFSSELTLETGISYRDDFKATSSGSEDRFALAFNGDYKVKANSGGHSADQNGSYTYYVGKDGAPFVSTEDNSGSKISGEYGFKLTGALGETCPSGAVTVETVDPLMDVENDTSSPFTSGSIKFTSGGKSSQVQFNNDGTVTVTGSDGSTDTFDYGQAVAAAAPCAGYGLAGLYFAAGFR